MSTNLLLHKPFFTNLHLLYKLLNMNTQPLHHKVQSFIENILNGLIIITALFIDITSFNLFGAPFLQLILCIYLIALIQSKKPLIITLFLLLGLESFIFFNSILYLPILAIILSFVVYLLRLWTKIKLCIALPALIIGLTIQKTFSIFYLYHSYNNFLYTIGHFLINTLFLSIYWFFENNGKQGNRSQ